MEAAGYTPPREGSARAFAITAAGDDVQMVTDGSTQVLVVLRHNPEADTSFVRVGVKQGPGDAMALFHEAITQGKLFTFRYVTTDTPVDKVFGKLKAFTGGAGSTPASLIWRADLVPMEQVDV